VSLHLVKKSEFFPVTLLQVSVGFVMDKTISIRKKSELRKEKPYEYSLKAHYLDQIQFTPGLRELLKNATLKEDIDEPIKSASDYSYSASCYAGDHYRLVGDAAGEIGLIFHPYISACGGLPMSL
jgi:hypothetical protein